MPVAKAPAAPTYSGSRSRWPTSTATRPRGSKPAGHQHQPGGGAGHHAGRAGEGPQVEQLTVHDGGEHQRGDRRRRRRPGRPARRAGRPTTGSATGRPSSASATTSRAASTCSRASACRGAFGHRSVKPGQRPGHPQRALEHRLGDGAGADRLAFVVVPLQGGAGHRGAQADLGRDLATVAAQRAVPQRLVDPLAGLLDGGGDVGEREQRARAGRWSPRHASDPAARTGRHPPGGRPGPPGAPTCPAGGSAHRPGRDRPVTAKISASGRRVRADQVGAGRRGWAVGRAGRPLARRPAPGARSKPGLTSCQVGDAGHPTRGVTA